MRARGLQGLKRFDASNVKRESWLALIEVVFIYLGLAVLIHPVQAQLRSPPVSGSARSHSGQFIAYYYTEDAPRLPRDLASLATNKAYIRLAPTTLAVSAERIKQALDGELQAPAGGRSKIYLAICQARSASDSVLVASERFKDGWRYGLQLPELLERHRYVQAITQALLLELANRYATTRAAEVPHWLVEGLARHLLATREGEIILTPAPFGGESRVLNVVVLNTVRDNPLKQLRAALAAEPPLSFQQLSWPSEDDLNGARAELYRNSAQLFVIELLRLKNGPASVLQLLETLPQYYNWQFAFMRAFSGTFQRPLDIEKWWTLQLAHFTGREFAETWPSDESWLKLDELLTTPVQVRSQTNALPHPARATLQKVLSDWSQADQQRTLDDKLAQLRSARLRMAPEMTALLDDYYVVLRTYAAKLRKIKDPNQLKLYPSGRRMVRQTIAELDALDAHRADWKLPGTSALTKK